MEFTFHVVKELDHITRLFQNKVSNASTLIQVSGHATAPYTDLDGLLGRVKGMGPDWTFLLRSFQEASNAKWDPWDIARSLHDIMSPTPDMGPMILQSERGLEKTLKGFPKVSKPVQSVSHITTST